MGIRGLLTKVHQIRKLSQPKGICSATLVLGPSYYSELTVSLCPVYLSCENKTAGVIRMQDSDKPSLCTRTSGAVNYCRCLKIAFSLPFSSSSLQGAFSDIFSYLPSPVKF